MLSLALDDENGILVYQAELLHPVDGSVKEVAVDSKSGQISVQAADDNNQNGQDVQNGENVQYEDQSDDNGKNEQDGQDDQSEQDEQDGENVQYEDESDDNGNAEQSETFDMSAVKVSFTQALSIVNTAYPNYSIISLELDSENGSLVYQAELINASDGSVLEAKVDPVSGQVLAQSASADEQNGNAGENENESENETENEN